MSGQRRRGTHMQWKFTQSLKKNEIMPFAATWMELETIILSEVSQKEKEKYMQYHLYVESNIRHK